MATESLRSHERTTVSVDRHVHERLKKIRPFNSMSFSELIEDMADQYEEDA